jgi:chemotaxis protein methyltransferase CheR
MNEPLATPQDTLDPKTFRKFCDLVYDTAGITLGPQKEALVSARMGKRMRKLGMHSFEEYYHFVEGDSSGTELVEMLNAISTNVTHFFREPRHFDVLARLLRSWADEGQRVFRIWCAASSTGEEPYTLAMTVREAIPDCRDIKILATDISTKVLATAQAGIYEDRHVEKVPDHLLRKYFARISGTSKSAPGEGAGANSRDQVACVRYQASESLRGILTFARLNLAKPPFAMRGPFDAIFCRNVMIYFDNEVRRNLLSECQRLLRPGGYLIVGHAESLSGMLSNFRSVEPAVYVK